jgi:hypothetical protein
MWYKTGLGKGNHNMAMEASLNKFADKVGETNSLRAGHIAFRLSGEDGGDYFLDCSTGDARLTEGQPPSTLLIEVIGDARRIRGILEGEKDVTRQFLAGGFWIRGGLQYASDLALELGCIEQPLL